MTAAFVKLLNMSISASWLVLAVLLLRLLLKKAPKWVSCLMWGVVALRLLMPVSVQSVFSLIPSGQVIPGDIAVSVTPAINSGIPAVNSAVNPMLTQQMIHGADMRTSILFFVSGMWTAGVLLMLVYGLYSSVRLRRQVQASVCQQKNIYVCDDVQSPFILGVFRPRIYVPSGICGQQLEYVLAHEGAHIKRMDHLWKPLGFLLLSVYWFNPLLWVAYILLCRDIERACDEKVIAALDNAGKRSYSEALVACSVHRRTIMSCPVAFGEVDVKSRIKGIVSYKKPALWIVGVSVMACMLTAACFLTDPIPCTHDYHGQITTPATCTQKGMQTLTCRVCLHSYTVPVELLAHGYDAGTVVTEPSCTQAGSKRHVCIACGAEKTEPMPMIAHTAGTLTVTKEPNCSQKGEAVSTCSQCQTVFVAQIYEMNGVHDLKQTVTLAATCNADGTAVNACTRCAYKEDCTLPKLKHTYEVYQEVPRSSCTGTWMKLKRCTVCDHEIMVEAPGREHTWSKPDSFGNRQCTKCLDIIMGRDPNWKSPADPIGNTKPTMPEDLFPVIKWDLGAP